MLRTQLRADPHGRFLHDLILNSCDLYPHKTALIDTSCNRRITYAEYGELVRTAARNLAAAGLTPGEVLAIYLPNSWEFAVAYHAATLAGAIPTLLNPTYRDREVRYLTAELLGRIGPEARGAIPALITVLREPFDLEERDRSDVVVSIPGPSIEYPAWSAARALGQMGPSREAIAALVEVICPEQVERPHLRPEPPAHLRNQVMHMSVTLQPAQGGDAHRPVRTDAAEVIP